MRLLLSLIAFCWTIVAHRKKIIIGAAEVISEYLVPAVTSSHRDDKSRVNLRYSTSMLRQLIRALCERLQPVHTPLSVPIISARSDDVQKQQCVSHITCDYYHICVQISSRC